MTDEWFVYLVSCSDESLYCGISKNVEKRIKTHNRGKGSKFTRSRLPVELVETTGPMSESESKKLEYYIKKLPRNNKILEIERLNKMEKLGKFLSLILRHKPETIGINLDKNGWANVDDLIRGINKRSHFNIDKKALNLIVETNNKKRYIFNNDKTKIRANQGHSIKINLNLKKTIPPSKLYHGTIENRLRSINSSGLNKGKRHHVHLSSTISTAINVGKRRGKPVVLEIDSKKMHKDKYEFFISENEVYLTDNVPSKYIKIINGI